jgi:hypothetical protein
MSPAAATAVLTLASILVFCCGVGGEEARPARVSPRAWAASHDAAQSAGQAPAQACPSAPAAAVHVTAAGGAPWAAAALAVLAAFAAGIAVGHWLNSTRAARLLAAQKAGTQATQTAGEDKAQQTEASTPPEVADAAAAAGKSDDEADAATSQAAPGSPSSPAASAAPAAAAALLLSPSSLAKIAQGEALASSQGGGGPSRWGIDMLEVEAAGQLVSTLMASLQLEPSQLSGGERVHLIQVVVQAWHTQQMRQHGHAVERCVLAPCRPGVKRIPPSAFILPLPVRALASLLPTTPAARLARRLGAEANVVRGEQRDISSGRAAHERARDAHALAAQRTQRFRALCSDTLTTGIAVMLLVAARRALTRGTLASLGAHCRAFPRTWGLWAAVQAGEAAACQLRAGGDAALAAALLLGAPWAVYRSGLLGDYHSMPVARLAVGLGVVCGAAGYAAVGRLGGDPGVWLLLWGAWTAAHVAASAAAHRVCRRSLAAAAAAAGGGGRAEAMFEEGLGWLPAAMWAGLGVALPVLTATLPFADLSFT